MTRLAVDFVTNLAPHYRGPLWKGLLESELLDAQLFFGHKPGSSIRTIDFDADEWRQHSARLQKLKNHYIRGVLVWQSGVLRRVLTTDAQVIVFLGQMYVISNWLTALVARFRGIKTISWGHGVYGSERGLKRWLRTRFLRLADIVLVYGERARNILIKTGHSTESVRVVYNSLAHAQHLAMRSQALDPSFFAKASWFDNPAAPVLIFIGRLTHQKRLDYLINAVEVLNKESRYFNLLFVGDGSERERLERLAAPISAQVHFFGPCYDETQLGMMIANADLCVSPGEVGLSAIHCLSFGTPVCTHEDFDHQMPEAEAIIEGETGVFFSRHGMNVADAIGRWFDAAPIRGKVRKDCFEVVDKKWNTGNQISIFEDAIRDIAGRS